MLLGHGLDLMALRRSGGDVDPSFSSVTLLMHFDGTNGSTTFTDNSSSPKTATVLGNAQISTTTPLFGSGCGLFDGTGDAVTFAKNAGFEFGSGDFTIEVAYNPTVDNTLQCITAYVNDTSSGFNADISWNLFLLGASSKNIQFTGFYGESSFSLLSTTVVAAGSYYRIAVSRNGTTWRLFINGALEATATQNITLNSPGSALQHVGQYINTTRAYANGRVDELRLTKGVGRYTAAYTVASSAFPNQ